MPITIKNAPPASAGELEALKAQIAMLSATRLAANGGKASFHVGGRTITGTVIMNGPGNGTYTVDGPAAKAKAAPKKAAKAKSAPKKKAAPKRKK